MAGAVKKLMALVCAVCPFCVARRAFLGSAYARVMAEAERGCPFCRAYDDLHSAREGDPGAAQTPSPQERGPESE